MPQNFSGQDLRGRSFANQDLTGADFSQTDLRGADFKNATLVGANLSHARIGLLPFRPRRAISHAFSYLGILGIILAWLMMMLLTPPFNLLSMNTQLLKAYLVVPGVTLFAALSVWFIVKSRQPQRFQITLATGTVAVAGITVIIVTAIVAGEALVATVSAGVTWTLLGAWIAMLTLDLPSQSQQTLRRLGLTMFAMGVLGFFLIFEDDRGFILLGICWMPLIGYIAAWMAVLAALILALALDQISTFKGTWTLAMVWTVGWSLVSLWVGSFSKGISLCLIAIIIAIIAAIAVLGPAIARSVKIGERRFPNILPLVAEEWRFSGILLLVVENPRLLRMLLLVGVAQGTTNFAGANLTDAILTGTHVANTNLREAILRRTHFEDGVSLENSRQLSDILNEHPDLPKLIKQWDQSKQPRVLWRWVLLGALGLLAFVNYSEGTSLPSDMIGVLRSSTYLQQVFDGASADITALAISPDGKLIAGGARNGAIEQQDIKTGRSRHTLTGHSKEVQAVIISADGKTLASSGRWDGVVKLWDLGAGQLIRTFHQEGASSSAISADGQTFATRNRDDILQLRELPIGQLLRTLSVNQRGGSFILSLAGQFLIDQDTGTADVWDLKTGQHLHTLTGNGFSVIFGEIAMSPDGQTLINVYRERENPIGGRSRRGSMIELWNVTTGRLTETRRVHGWIDAIAISPDGQILVGGDDLDDVIKVWDLQTGQLLYVLPKVLNSVDHIAISPDGQFLASSSFWGE